MSDPKFVHLRVHSDFSMVDGLSKVPPLVKKVAEMGMPALALDRLYQPLWLGEILRYGPWVRG